MVRASLIYIGVTILLALVDAIREKVKWGKVANISHKLSWQLAAISGVLVSAYFVWPEPIWRGIEKQWLMLVSFIGIRLAFFDPAQNLFRIALKTNPTMRLDYVSTTTGSWVDQHIHLSFWQKRAVGVAGWFVIVLIYYKIF